MFPSSEQQLIVDSIEEFLADQFAPSRLTAHGAQHGELARAQLVALGQMGWLAAGLDETAGGLGLGAAEQALIFRALGRHLAPVGVLAGVIASQIAGAAGERDLAGSLGRGEAVAAFAIPLPGAQICAEPRGSYLLLGGRGAQWAVICGPDGAGLASLDAIASRVEHPGSDETTSTERIAFGGVPIAAWRPDSAIGLRANLLVAAMLVGICEATRDMAVEYAKTRIQFGRPIGSFQAIKHKCADMAVRAEAVEHLLSFAAIGQDARHDDSAFQAASIRLLAADYAIRNAAENIQVHGAMGFTAELSAHLYLKRAHLLSHIGGNRRSHQRAILASPSAQRPAHEL